MLEVAVVGLGMSLTLVRTYF